MLDNDQNKLGAGDIVAYAAGVGQFRLGVIHTIGPARWRNHSDEMALLALFGDSFENDEQRYTSVYNGLSLQKVASGLPPRWVLTLMPELRDTHDRAHTDALIEELRALT